MKILDLMGEICPLPEVITKRAVEKLAPGEQIKVLVDYPKSVENITRWVNGGSQKILELKESGPCQWEILIQKEA